MNKTGVYVSILAIILVGWVIYFVINYKADSKKEHFTEEGSNYDARLQVMKIFDMVLSRKPTTEEIEKYSKIKNEQDMLVQILQDYKNTGTQITVINAPAESNSPSLTNVDSGNETISQTTTIPSMNVNEVVKTTMDNITVTPPVAIDQNAVLLVKQEMETFDQSQSQNQLITVNKSRVQKLIEEIYERVSELKTLLNSN